MATLTSTNFDHYFNGDRLRARFFDNNVEVEIGDYIDYGCRSCGEIHESMNYLDEKDRCWKSQKLYNNKLHKLYWNRKVKF